MRIIIGIATHKPYWMPDDPVYLPLHAGHAGKADLGYTGDDTGKNISEKNPNYCELTCLYWLWKNTDADFIGLVHYRRYFANGKQWKPKEKRILSQSGFEKELEKVPILLPKPRHYWIETNYSHYAHAHHAEDLDLTRSILSTRYPDYTDVFDRCMKRCSGHRFNMLVMKKDLLNQYCEWLFSILFELENRLDLSSYSEYDSRVFGFVSERLLDVWLEKNQIPYRELPYVFLEKQNWWMKGIRFINRKIRAGG